MVGPEGYDQMWDAIEGRNFDRRGNSISMRDCCRLWGLKGDYRIIQQEYVGDYWISTVWLGMDHRFGPGPPLIFETMVFNHTYPAPRPPSALMTEDGELDLEALEESPEYTSATDLDCERYSTEEQARKGHLRMVQKVRLFVEASTHEERGTTEGGGEKLSP